MNRSNSLSRMTRHLPTYLLLSIISLLFIGPVLWMVSGSFKSIGKILQYPPKLLPEVFRWENYAQVFSLQPFGRQILNSVMLLLLICADTLLLAIHSVYALARVRPSSSACFFLIVLCVVSILIYSV